MTSDQFELLYTISRQDISREEKLHAAGKVLRECVSDRIESEDINLFYMAMLDLWRSLGESEEDRNNNALFHTRKQLAFYSWHLSRKRYGSPRIFRYFPAPEFVEGFESRVKKKIIQGKLKTTYGSSLYEFHWEYPIEGIGVKKDLIYVKNKAGEKSPLFDWCRENEIIVYCNRCGLEITYEVSKDCPFQKFRRKKTDKTEKLKK